MEGSMTRKAGTPEGTALREGAGEASGSVESG